MESLDINNPMNCTVNLIKKIKRNLTRKSDNLMRKFDISSGQFSLLTALYYNEGLKASQMSIYFEMEKSTMSRELKIMKKKGLIRYNKNSKGRGKEIYLTPLGREIYEKALKEWKKIQKNIINHIGIKNFKALIDINEKLQDMREKQAE